MSESVCYRHLNVVRVVDFVVLKQIKPHREEVCFENYERVKHFVIHAKVPICLGKKRQGVMAESVEEVHFLIRVSEINGKARVDIL